MAMHQGRQSPSQSRLPRLSSAAKAARALCVFKQKQSFPRPVEIRTSCQPQNAVSEFHRPFPTAQSTHATENPQLTCWAVDWKEECFFLPQQQDNTTCKVVSSNGSK
jgi:hypothetical protein